jgi:hypothetical protein
VRATLVSMYAQSIAQPQSGMFRIEYPPGRLSSALIVTIVALGL